MKNLKTFKRYIKGLYLRLAKAKLRWSVSLIFLVLLAACSNPQDLDFKEAERLQTNGDLDTAVAFYDKAHKRNQTTEVGVLAAKEAARILQYQIKDYQRAIDYYRKVTLHSQEIQDRIYAQKRIAEIEFDNLQNYDQAILEYNRLLSMPHSDSEEAAYKKALAQAYYYKGNFFQSLSEAEDLLKKNIDKELKFDLAILRANIFLTLKNYTKAAEHYQQILKDFPERAQKDDVAFSLILCYEELELYPKAIEILQSLKGKYDPEEYLDIRIKKIQTRQKNQPGSQGKYRK